MRITVEVLASCGGGVVGVRSVEMIRVRFGDIGLNVNEVKFF